LPYAHAEILVIQKQKLLDMNNLEVSLLQLDPSANRQATPSLPIWRSQHPQVLNSSMIIDAQ
jgi:hypothetical protein